MDRGDLVFIDDTGKDLEVKIVWAVENYRRKYGRQPNVVMVHPSLLKGERKQVGSLRLEPRRTMLPSYLWVGEAEATPLAR